MKRCLLLITLLFTGLLTSAQSFDERLELLQQMIGKPAPNFKVETLDGKKLTLTDLKNKIIVINFWFVGCAPCEEEMPLLNKLTQQYKNSDDVIFIGFSRSTAAATKAFLSNKPFNYQIVADAKAFAQLYNVSGYPSHFVIDKQGIVRFASIAAQDDIDAVLHQQIEMLH